MIDGAVGEAADRSSAESLADYLDRVRDGLDIDGDGEPRALTDGLLLIRYLFGFRDEALISGAVGDGATRRSAKEIEEFIEKRI